MSNILRIIFLCCHCFVQIYKYLCSHARGSGNTVGHLSEIFSLIFVIIGLLLFIQNTEIDKNIDFSFDFSFDRILPKLKACYEHSRFLFCPTNLSRSY